ncbi:flavodoxin [Chlorobium sp. N1]|uniref:flavodoxin n=1 Tax=Chlorobium sp. N1 TaxID=2491138 RepID=UPI00103C2D35|nr:flavodoxin [Chlorobium sp. N1]TCD47372.1 flavodoxin [Chlorobium sp. N1]
MKRTGIFFGTQTGNTEAAANLIAAALGVGAADVRDIASASPEDFAGYDTLILGTSTWGAGELQDDWRAFLPGFERIDFSSRTVALFGLGDQFSYGDWYLDGMGAIYDRLVERGARVVGAWPVEGYEYAGSQAVRDGRFVGLALDADNQDELTADRVQQWVGQLQSLV